MTATRRDIYQTIACAVIAALPEPESQEFGPGDTVWLRFDNHDDARLWARWHSPECLASFYTGGTVGQPLACYFGERPEGFRWSIVGKQSLTPQEQEATSVDGNDRPTVEQVTIAALAPDSLRVPCGRCGHDENIHQYDTASNQTGRLCIECRGWCAPVVLVPAHVQGWAIEGRTP